MSRVNLNQPPYHDDYDWAKKYIQFLAIPGRVAQAREFTGMQSAMRGIIKSIGDSILKNGDIIEGCQIIKGIDNRVTVTAGKVYIEGIVMDVQESIVAISGTGTETIGVRLDEQIIDEFTDGSLRDPAQGYANYNQPGCYRLKRTVTVVANDPEAVTLATFIEGDQMLESYAPEYDTLTQTLARRTYDESGSYIVEGLRVRTEELNSSEYNIVIEPGKAYVLGYELRIPTARRIRVTRANTYSSVETRKTYISGTSDYQLYSYPFVHDITRVIGIKATSESQSIANNVDSVQIRESNVLRITSVVQGDKTYTVGGSSSNGDCYLEQVGNTYYLKWNGTENYPATGSTYTVNYEYEKSYLLGTDFELVLINGGHYIRWVGDTPSDNTVFTVHYNQYLARQDIVYLDRYGYTKVMQGTPAEYNHDVAPEAPLNTLALAIVSNPPNGSVTDTESTEMITVSNIGLTRFTMTDIQSMLNRIQTIEYDQAVISLNTEARQEDNTLDMKGIFTDPFIDVSRIDMYYNLNNGNKVDSSKPIFDLALDLASNIAYLPIITKTHDVVYDASNSTSKIHDRLITLNTTGENVVLSQMNATKSFLINPYSMFPQVPEVSVTPSVDSWIEDTIIEIPRSIQESTIVAMSTRTVDNRKSLSGWMATQYATRSSTSVRDTAIGTQTTSYTSDSVISEKAITYIRQREVTVEGQNFPEGLDNIKCYFDGVLVPLTPIEGTSAGTESGSVKAKADGSLKATFKIPPKVLTGTREVLLKSDIVRDGYFSEGFTLYIAQGTARNIQRTVTTVTTVLLERTTTTTLNSVYVDPVGQTFVLDRMTMIKGIDVYFENKPTTNTPVICEIREVNNGTITSKVYAHKSLAASQVNVSTDSSLATRFNFSDPVLLEENKEYAFVLRSTSNAYTVWVAELGGTDVLSKNIIMKNALLSGVMLSSSNNSTWTSHQTQDIKFRLVEDVYAMNSVANFGLVTAEQFSRILLSADSAIPDGTEVNWMYSLNGNSYNSITPYNIVNLDTMNTSFYLRATLSRSASNISPMIATDTINVTTSCYDLEGNYISRNISGLDPYTSVKIILDIYEPSGTSVSVKISNNNGNTLIDAVRSDKAATLDYGWREITYNATVGSSTQCKIFINLKSVANSATPAIRRLRVIMS